MFTQTKLTIVYKQPRVFRRVAPVNVNQGDSNQNDKRTILCLFQANPTDLLMANEHEHGCLGEHDATPRQSIEDKKNLHSYAINHHGPTFQDVSIGTTTRLEATSVLSVFIPPSATIV